MLIDFIFNHWLDITTTILGLAYIILEYRASIWLWAVGFVMQVLGIILYYQKGLYADCGMEFYYLSMTIYGWWRWRTGGPSSHEPVGTPPRQSERRLGGEAAITHFPRRLILPWLLIIGALWGGIYWILVTFTDSTVPLADSFTTALSVLGIWALAHKYVEQWLFWIAVDVVSCYLYFLKDIPFKGSLYGLYVIIAVAGFVRWHRQASTPPTTGAAAAVTA